MSVESACGDWIEWAGGKCPLPRDTLVNYWLDDDNDESAGLLVVEAGFLDWSHDSFGGNVLKYRVVRGAQ